MSYYDLHKGPAWPSTGVAAMAAERGYPSDLLARLRERVVQVHAATACDAIGLANEASQLRAMNLSDARAASDALFAMHRAIYRPVHDDTARHHAAFDAVWDAARALACENVVGVIDVCINAARCAYGAQTGQYDTMAAHDAEQSHLTTLLAC